jgi:hypothetical protein
MTLQDFDKLYLILGFTYNYQSPQIILTPSITKCWPYTFQLYHKSFQIT